MQASASLKVTYAFDGSSWASTPVDVYVNPNGAPSPSAALAMVQDAISTWDGAGFPIQFKGQTASAARIVDGDTINEVGWGTLQDGLLAQTSWMTSGTNTVAEEHIVFNTGYVWADGSNGSFDIQSTALHELGHWIVLRDQYGPGDTNDIMYGYGDSHTAEARADAKPR